MLLLQKVKKKSGFFFFSFFLVKFSHGIWEADSYILQNISVGEQ